MATPEPHPQEPQNAAPEPAQPDTGGEMVEEVEEEWHPPPVTGDEANLGQSASSPPPEPPPQAEPGMYVCVVENAGESSVLGGLVKDAEYIVTETSTPEYRQAVAALVEN